MESHAHAALLVSLVASLLLGWAQKQRDSPLQRFLQTLRACFSFKAPRERGKQSQTTMHRQTSPFAIPEPCAPLHPCDTSNKSGMDVEDTPFDDAALQATASKALRVILTSAAAPTHSDVRASVLGSDERHAR